MKTKKKVPMIVLALIPVGVAINFATYFIATSLKLPLFLDATGTVIVAATCGPVAGGLCGLLFSIISGISYPTSMLYFPVSTICGVIIGLTATKLKWMTKFSTSLLVALLLAINGVFLSYPITVMLFGGVTASGQSVILLGLQAMGFSQTAAYFISALMTEFLDKFLTVIVGFFVIKLISDRFLSKLPYGSLYFKKSYKGIEESVEVEGASK